MVFYGGNDGSHRSSLECHWISQITLSGIDGIDFDSARCGPSSRLRGGMQGGCRQLLLPWLSRLSHSNLALFMRKPKRR